MQWQQCFYLGKKYVESNDGQSEANDGPDELNDGDNKLNDGNIEKGETLVLMVRDDESFVTTNSKIPVLGVEIYGWGIMVISINSWELQR